MYGAPFTLGEVALNVRNLAHQTHFYQSVLGLTLLAQGPDYRLLGVDGQGLVRLIQTDQEPAGQASYGLYHLAILLPSRQDFANFFRYLIDKQVALQGGSHHGYSEALYLADLEGNGIEVYHDFPQENWDKQSDGRILGRTDPLDTAYLYQLAQPTDGPYQLPNKSRMGHVHLSVRESTQASLFYQSLLQLGDKFSLPSAAWLAAGDYHHHLAVNEWAGKHQANREPGMPGLAYYSLLYHNPTAFHTVRQQLEKQDLPFDLAPNQLTIVDRDGIETRLLLVETDTAAHEAVAGKTT